MNKTFSTKIFGVKEIGCPFIMVSFDTKDGKRMNGMMLVDTGAEDCYIDKRILELLPENKDLGRVEKTKNINETSNATDVPIDFKFSIENETFIECFYIEQDTNMAENWRCPDAFGIIGRKFMTKYELALDFINGVLRHTDAVRFTKNNAIDYALLFDKEHRALVGFNAKGKDYYLLVDSGCNITTITQKAVKNSGIVTKNIDMTCDVDFVLGKYNALQMAEVRYNMYSNDIENSSKFKFFTFDDQIRILPHMEYVQGNISGLLSASFMAKHKWIVDFGIGAIIRAKDPNTVILLDSE